MQIFLRLLPVPAFALFYLLAGRIWHVPSWFAVAYVAASALCFAMYAIDKAAAMKRQRRVPERTLLMLSLAGGWPGGLLGQVLLRHKTRNASFQAAFWAGALVNVAAFVALISSARSWIGWPA